MEQFKSQVLDEIKKVDEHIERLEAKAEEQAKLNGQVQEETKAELQKMQETYTQLKERLDSVEAKGSRIGAGEVKGFKAALMETLEDNREKLKAFRSGAPKARGLSFDVKDAVTMTTGDSLTGEVIAPTRVPGVVHDPDRQVHIRQLLQTTTTDSNMIRYVEESGYEDGTSYTPEGSIKPKSSFELEAKTAEVVKIATHFRISEEMLEDIPGLAGYITTRGTTKYRLKEDNEVLYGAGTSGTLKGLAIAATGYSGLLPGAPKNEYDVLLDALAQLATNDYTASAILINPKRWYSLLRAKNENGSYILPDAVRFGVTPPQVDGVPVIANTAVQGDDFLVANLPMMATLFDRKGVSVRFYDQNEDDAVRNLITVVIEGRLALPIYLPGAGRYGDFSDILGASS